MLKVDLKSQISHFYISIFSKLLFVISIFSGVLQTNSQDDLCFIYIGSKFKSFIVIIQTNLYFISIGSKFKSFVAVI